MVCKLNYDDHKGEEIYVAMLMPFSDGSGTPVVLGAYSSRPLAEARCWRALQRLGYDQPTAVYERPLDLDNEGDPDDGSGAVELAETS